MVCLHSTAATYVPQQERMIFLKQLRSDYNPSLWRSSECDGDGKWIYEGLACDTLIMVSDGSYNKMIADDICAAMVVIKYSHSNQILCGSWVEKSDWYSADNY